LYTFVLTFLRAVLGVSLATDVATTYSSRWTS
jgi:hypothetical protein